MAFDYAAKIQAMLANADDESLSDEARASYRAKAEEFMVKYRIEEEDALATDEAASTPILRNIRVTTRYTGRLGAYYTSTFLDIARHCGVRVHMTYDEGYVANVVGYEGDVRYAEFLWTSALLMFSTRINPTWDDALSPEENVWRLRNAGIKRAVIADRAGRDGRKASDRSWVQRVYLRECEKRNEPPRAAGLGHQAEVFQQAYADEFRATLAYRMRAARDATDSVRGGLVLHGRSDRVDEAFYTRFPQYRPNTDPTPAPEYKPCPRCAKAKSGNCRQHPGLTKADYARWDRLENSASARAGRESGRAAADGVVIQRGHTRPTRVEDGGYGAIEA